MGEAHAAYASALAQRMAQFLHATRLRVEPSVAFVSCECADHQHFVPASALDTHLEATTGDHTSSNKDTIEEALRSHASPDTDTVHKALESNDAPAGEDEDGEQSMLQSLLEPLASPQDAHGAGDENQVLSREQLINVIAELASGTAEFYTIVQKWQRIPRAFAHLATTVDNNSSTSTNSVAMVVPKQSVQGWLIAELSHTLFKDELLDMELVDYIVGLLEHPEFCQPDLLVLELHEFLGQDTERFVLALWKFLVVEIAMRIAFNTTKDTLEKQLRAKREQDAADQAKHMLEMLRATEKTPCVKICFAEADAAREASKSAVVSAERDYKRRRPTYRGKKNGGGPKSNREVLREVLEKQMLSLCVDCGWELAEDPNDAGDERQDGSQRPDPSRRALNADWMSCTDALRVRDMGRGRTKTEADRGADREVQAPVDAIRNEVGTIEAQAEVEIAGREAPGVTHTTELAAVVGLKSVVVMTTPADTGGRNARIVFLSGIVERLTLEITVQ
ncbi:hypothetical protein FI667_g14028, partial [Globisporangium splendens]